MSSILIPCVFLFLSFNIGEKSQQPSEQEETPDQSSERVTSEDMLRLVAEVKELKAILSEGERQQKESEKLQKKMIEEWEEMKLQLQRVLSTEDSKYHKTYTTDWTGV